MSLLTHHHKTSNRLLRSFDSLKPTKFSSRNDAKNEHFNPSSFCEFHKLIKKAAFTLAEVLIVLGIIGIISEMTIPTLMNNVSDAQTKAGMKVAFSTLSQAALNAATQNGGSLSGLANLKDTIKDQLSYIKDCGAAVADGCWPAGTLSLDGTASNFDGLHALTLKNGMSMIFYTDSTDCAAGAYGRNDECGWVLIDINGMKKPNRIGKDSGAFSVYSDGTVRVWGSQASDCDSVSGYTAGMYCTWKFIYGN